jgi:DNA-binding MarR family transcriptional regulator
VTEVESTFVYESHLPREERVLWRRFVETHAAIVRKLDDDLRAQSGLTLSAFEVLYELVRAPGNRRRMAELAERLLFTRSGVTRVVDRLERDGLVERRVCTSDGRGVYANLTEQGYETFIAAAGPHVAGIRELFFDRLDGWDDLLRRILHQLAPEKEREKDRRVLASWLVADDGSDGSDSGLVGASTLAERDLAQEPGEDEGQDRNRGGDEEDGA